jgi:YVTN family beta-propeller protein
MERKYMRVRGFTLASLFLFLFAAAILPAVAQTLITTVPVEQQPNYLAANAASNKIYVVNRCGTDPSCAPTSPGTVTIINGVTNQTTTLSVGVRPDFLVINPVTNKIYVTNRRDGTVSVINGATGTVTATLTVGSHPIGADVNPFSNKIYVANSGNDFNNTVSVIDGATDTVTDTITVGWSPNVVAVNPITNKIYVVNHCGNDPNGCTTDGSGASGTLSVIDGATNTVTNTLNVGIEPGVVLANTVTNKIYVGNACGSNPQCLISGQATTGSVTVIDGVTLGIQTVVADYGSDAMAFNPVVNQVYVANKCGVDPTCASNGTVTLIDGVTLTTSRVTVGLAPADVEVNPVTDEIYVANFGSNTVTAINGATLQTSSVGVGQGPAPATVNPSTNRVYVSNLTDLTVSVLGGVAPNALQFVAVTPCRLIDTRQTGGPIPGGTSRNFAIPQEGGCNIPTTAAAYSLNVTVVPASVLGYLTMWPTGEQQPVVSTMNSPDGRIKANAAIVPAGYQGAVSVYVTNTTQVILDIDGYFAPTSGSTLAFYPLTPCRIADTRKDTFPAGLGVPHLSGTVERDFPVLSSPCIPSGVTPQAYSLNFTAVPYPALGNPLGYLEVWPKDQMPQNPVSTLNNVMGTIVANAAIVPAGTGGEITAFANNDTDLIIDIDGYFAPAGLGGLSLYPAAPCRVIDTRHVGNGQPFSGTLTPPVDVLNSPCGPPAAAQAYVFNATVVPQGALGYLTLWPDGTGQPVVSTLNAFDGSLTNNMAIVPSTNGKVDAYAGSGLTQLILDISSYFAP